MPISVEQQGRRAHVTLRDELTIYGVNEYRDVLSPLLTALDELHIDLSQVS